MDFRPEFGDFRSDFKDFRDFSPGLRYFRSDFKDYRNVRKYRDFRDFKSDFGDFRTFVPRISNVVCPSTKIVNAEIKSTTLMHCLCQPKCAGWNGAQHGFRLMTLP